MTQIIRDDTGLYVLLSYYCGPGDEGPEATIEWVEMENEKIRQAAKDAGKTLEEMEAARKKSVERLKTFVEEGGLDITPPRKDLDY